MSDHGWSYFLTVLLVAVMAGALVTAMMLWPREPLAGMTKEQLLAKLNRAEALAVASYAPDQLFAFVAQKVPATPEFLTGDQILAIIVGCFGAVGGALHSLRSLIWFVGHDTFRRRWFLYYLATPLIGGGLAIGVYILFRGGLVTANGTNPTNPYGVAGMGFLIGMFSQEAIEKLKEVAKALFAAPPVGRDTATPKPDFQLTTAKNVATVSAGTDATFEVNIGRTGGFADEVTLTVEKLPAGAGVPTFNPATATKPPKLTVTIPTTGIAPGTYPSQIVGKAGTLTHAIDISLVVTKPV